MSGYEQDKLHEFYMKTFFDGNDGNSKIDIVDTNQIKMCDVTSMIKSELNNLNGFTSHPTSDISNTSNKNSNCQIMQNNFSYFQQLIGAKHFQNPAIIKN